MKLFVFSLFYICKKTLVSFTHDDFLMFQEPDLVYWLSTIAEKEGYSLNQLEYNFVDAEALLSLNQKYLNHDTDTDIITFDYTETKRIQAEAFISCPALLQNAKLNGQTAENEVLRLLSHALLHCMGYNDKTAEQKEVMRLKEEECINLFHVKH
jgi:probable rRNA maturation factor